MITQRQKAAIQRAIKNLEGILEDHPIYYESVETHMRSVANDILADASGTVPFTSRYDDEIDGGSAVDNLNTVVNDYCDYGR